MRADPAPAAGPPPACTLFVLLARAAPVGVILRRGPSAWMQVIGWDTQTDRFTYGQWFHGHLYGLRCDLSPDGTYFLYFASQFGKRRVADTWTAISRPPYLTALALWPKGDAWAGGGLFLDAHTVWLNHRLYQAVPHPTHRPQGLRIVPNPDAGGEDEPVYYRRLARDGWTVVQEARYRDVGRRRVQTDPQIWEKSAPAGPLVLRMAYTGYETNRPGGGRVFTFALRDPATGAEASLADATWADWDGQGRLVYTVAGRLLAARPAGLALTPQVLGDFTALRPQSLRAPAWAQRW